jgi:23S rRNA (uracil1939-C5)-methyltransferase
MGEIELTLDSLAFGGEAVGRDAGGRVVFVAGGAPGDRVIARVVDDKRNFVRAELVRVVAAGPARVDAPCPLIARCGGCPWQHVGVDAQLEAKQAIVARALGKSGARVEPIVRSAAALGYRTRARLTARNGALGFAGRRSHEVVDVERCLALEPALDAALALARRALGKAHGEARGGALGEAHGSTRGGAALAALGEDGTIAGLVQDGVVELALTSGRGADRARLEAVAAALVGQGAIVRVTVDDPNAPAAGFAQANAAQNLVLRRLVSDAARAAGCTVLELYAGDGNFTQELAAVAPSGVAVEGDRPAAARLRERLRAHPSWTVVAEPAARAVERLAAAEARFDVVVLDPPRAGAADLIARVPALLPARLVYVSCDPMTLARDLATLGRYGYAARVAWPVDMMPQTWHVEVVVLVEKA